MSEEQSKEEIIASLLESNQTLRDEVNQLRNSNRVLRQVHRVLRSANESLRRQIDTASFNDDTFKKFCEGEFDAKGTTLVDGGLPESKA